MINSTSKISVKMKKYVIILTYFYLLSSNFLTSIKIDNILFISLVPYLPIWNE